MQTGYEPFERETTGYEPFEARDNRLFDISMNLAFPPLVAAPVLHRGKQFHEEKNDFMRRESVPRTGKLSHEKENCFMKRKTVS